MKDSKNLVIGILCAVVCVMAVAYAAFTQNLNVNGTAEITGKWDVKFTTVSCSTTGTAVDNQSGLVGTNGLTAKVNFTLVAPGDSAYCNLTVSNGGTIPARFVELSLGAGATEETLAEPPIVISIVRPTDVTLAPNTSHVWRVNASYDSTTTTLEGAVTTKTTTITLNYQQNLG